MFGGFSFGGGEEMPHMGGMGGRRGGPPPDTTKLYKVLGVDKNASQADIKKAYRKAAMTHHPDKGGDPELFKELGKAYEILSDNEKRAVYDQHGEEAASGEGAGDGMHGAQDIFSSLFGGGGGRGGRQSGAGSNKRRGEDVAFPLKVSLEDLYMGTTKKLRLTKNVICKDCDGKGGHGDAAKKCAGCRGQGVKMVIRQLGPGMIQQMQTYCNECNGEGTVISEKDRCKTCQGQKVSKEKKTLDVHINKGMAHNEKIVFQGEGDESPDTIPGNVVVVLQQKDHETFRRQGADLFMRKNISLLEALTGFSFPVTHLDGRTLLVKSTPGVVYKPGDLKAVRDEGMPQGRNNFEHGNLYFEFHVVFPEGKDLNDNLKKLLVKVLPSGRPTTADGKEMMDVDVPHDAEEVRLEDVDVEAERAKRRGDGSNKEAYDEDQDHEHQHQQGPSCRQA